MARKSRMRKAASAASAVRRHKEPAQAVPAGALKGFIERVERLEDEKAALAADIREVYAEAKTQGFDAKIMRQVVRLRKMDKIERDEQAALLDLYLDAVGMKRGG
jgi:uncharacterized protein (UPF0335 family)